MEWEATTTRDIITARGVSQNSSSNRIADIKLYVNFVLSFACQRWRELAAAFVGASERGNNGNKPSPQTSRTNSTCESPLRRLGAPKPPHADGLQRQQRQHGRYRSRCGVPPSHARRVPAVSLGELLRRSHGLAGALGPFFAPRLHGVHRPRARSRRRGARERGKRRGDGRWCSRQP